MDIARQVLDLVQQALVDLDTPGVRLSSVIRKAIRIARLREDYENLYCLSMEMRTVNDREARQAIYLEIAPHLTREELANLNDRSVEAYLARRFSKNLELRGQSEEEMILGLPVPEIEARIENLREMIRDLTVPASLGAPDYVKLEREQSAMRQRLQVVLAEWIAIIQRISQSVHDYLSRTEQQLYYGKANADIFEQNRRFVHDRLYQVSPSVLEQFRSAQERLAFGGAEAGSHALTSCRRILKSVADYLYPPRTEPVTGRDGKARILTDEKYVARLWQYVYERVKGTASRKLIELQVEELCKRIDRLNELSSKGVHSDVSPFEVHQCVLQTYLLVGDLLRLAEGSSGLVVSVEDAEEWSK